MQTLPVIWPPAGRYVVAVSGGVDSVVLLHVLEAAANQHGYRLSVAHFDHAMRPDSPADAQFVRNLSERMGLTCHLGRSPGGLVSEAQARTARYAFLNQVAARSSARLVTAHHQDDLIETSLLNLARGSGWEGIAPMRRADPVRPFIGIPRADITSYAQAYHLDWREDASNADLSNPRNLLRRELLACADEEWRRAYLGVIAQTTAAGSILASELDGAGARNGGVWTFEGEAFASASMGLLAALIVYWSRRLMPGIDLDRRLASELALFARTARPDRWRPVRGGLRLERTYDGFRIRNLARAPNGSK